MTTETKEPTQQEQARVPFHNGNAKRTTVPNHRPKRKPYPGESGTVDQPYRSIRSQR